jgi:hypothetical protein
MLQDYPLDATNSATMAEPPDPGRLLTALTTEHFTLQGARAATTSEGAARTSLFLGSVTSALVALGFLATVSGGDSALFRTFALTALPTLCFLGLVTYIRLVELGTEDVLYGRAINRIRAHYLRIAGDDARLFMMKAHDDALGVLTNMGLRVTPTQLYLTNSFAIGVVTAVLVGSVVALAVGVISGAPLGVDVAAGAAAAMASIYGLMAFTRGHYGRVPSLDEPMFPSPAEPAGASRSSPQ